MARTSLSPAGALLLLSLFAGPAAAQVPVSWLDRPLTNWNIDGRRIPKPAARGDESIDEVVRRCRLTLPKAIAGQRTVRAAGWIPFRYFGQDLARGDVEVVGGMAGADGMCRPQKFNVFVFVGGRFAGTLSPTVMDSRTDSASGQASFAESGIDVQFDRYAASDPLCCPHSHVTVRYRIDRMPQGAVVVPVSVAPTPQ
jgi:LppP/LprE lipoprotein